MTGFDADAHAGGSGGVHADVAACVLVSGNLLVGDLEEFAHDSFDAVVLGVPPCNGNVGVGMTPIAKSVRVRHAGFLRDFGKEFAVGYVLADLEGDAALFFLCQVMPDVRFVSHHTGR